jgi:hypothetical protein
MMRRGETLTLILFDTVIICRRFTSTGTEQLTRHPMMRRDESTDINSSFYLIIIFRYSNS